jgi:hypothetical protein
MKNSCVVVGMVLLTNVDHGHSNKPKNADEAVHGLSNVIGNTVAVIHI